MCQQRTHALQQTTVDQPPCKRTLSDLVAEIDEGQQAANLSSAIRLFVLQFYQEHAQQAVARQRAAE